MNRLIQFFTFLALFLAVCLMSLEGTANNCPTSQIGPPGALGPTGHMGPTGPPGSFSFTGPTGPSAPGMKNLLYAFGNGEVTAQPGGSVPFDTVVVITPGVTYTAGGTITITAPGDYLATVALYSDFPRVGSFTRGFAFNVNGVNLAANTPTVLNENSTFVLTQIIPITANPSTLEVINLGQRAEFAATMITLVQLSN